MVCHCYVRMLTGFTRRKSGMMFYTSFIERAEQASHVVPNEGKGYIAKDLTFLRKLDVLLKDPESSRESGPASSLMAYLLTVSSPRYWQICAPPLCSSLGIVPGTIEPVPGHANIFDAGLEHNRHGKLLGRGLFG